MVGWFAGTGGRRFLLARTEVLGLPLLRLETPPARGERAALKRAARGARLLAGAGCRRAAAPAGFPYWQILKEQGLRPVDPELLVQAQAVPLALECLERRGTPLRRAAVALRGQRVSRALFEAAQTLCPRVRTLSVSAPGGGEELRAFLREEYGAADLEEGALPPDCTLLFSPPRPGEIVPPGALRLYGPAPDLAGLGLRLSGGRTLPEGLDPLPALALLWEEGRISGDELEVFSTDAERN